MKQTISIGIDTGTNTGFAVFSITEKKFLRIETLAIHQAILEVQKYNQDPEVEIKMIRVEDARKRVWFGKFDREESKYGKGVREGAGSIKRDAKIWEDFLTEYKIPFELVKPSAGSTKWKADSFKNTFKWTGRTSNHSRDAAVLVAQ